MTSYGTNANTQKLAFGSTDSNQDTRCTSARDLATSIINSKLGFTSDLNSPTNEINRCCDFIAAGIILSGQITVDSNDMHPFYKQGMKMLDEIDLSSMTEVNQDSFIVDRF